MLDVSQSTHYPLSLHFPVITSLASAAFGGFYHRGSSHRCIHTSSVHLILAIFRPVVSCCVHRRGNQEEGVRGGHEGTDDSILASDYVSFPLVLISWCFFQIAPFACHYYGCLRRCESVCDRGEGNEQRWKNIP